MGKERLDPDTARAAENGDAELEDGPLAERLRNLTWPAPEPGRAEDAWERFQRRLAEAQRAASDADGDDAA